MRPEVSERLDVARAVASEAGKLLLKHWGRLASYDHKGVVDLVTVADKGSEALIRETVAARFPGDGFFGEETGETRGDSGFCWLVDPLDGTTNFVHGLPVFAVSIGIHLDGAGEAAVVHLPALHELYFAARGEGAFGPGGKLRVSRTDRLLDSLLATGIPYSGSEIVETVLGDWRRAIVHGQGVRRLGSAATDLAFVACGRFEAFWERRLSPWDTAAGALLVQEAGGRVTDFSGGPFSPHRPEILATNGTIHQAMLEALFAGR